MKINRYYRQAVMGADVSDYLARGVSVAKDVAADVEKDVLPPKKEIEKKGKEVQKKSSKAVFQYLGYVGAGLAALYFVAIYAFRGR